MSLTQYQPNYEVTSPYANTKIVGRYLSYYEHRRIPPHINDRLVVVNDYSYHYRPDNLAVDVYGDDNYWWVIPVRNSFQDLCFDLFYGRMIIIPDPVYVKSILNG